MKKFSMLFLFCVMFVIPGLSQTSRDARLKMKGYINPQEIVSLDSTMRMDQALLVLNELSKQFAGKIILDLEKRKNPIGVYIVNQHWRDALDMILSHNGLTYIEEADYIRIVPVGEGATAAAAPGQMASPGAAAMGELPPTLASRDVKISAVFFSTNLVKAQNYGISWNFSRSKSKEPTMDYYLSSGLDQSDTIGPVPATPKGSFAKGLASLSSPPEFSFANIDALIKFFGSNKLGDVESSPDIVVRSGKEGRIQIGTDIFVTTRDVAGNAISQQISTGTIIDVVPTVYTQSDTSIIALDLTIEQSNASAGTTGTEISRDQVKTKALLFDGEETVIGGLTTTSETEYREGIPILKDLPWWVFGLRYIFGSDSKSKEKDELIILLKAELVKPIRERMVHRQTQQEIMDSKRKEYEREYNQK